MAEQWRAASGDIEVSNQGKVRHDGQPLVPYRYKDTLYHAVRLSDDYPSEELVHRLGRRQRGANTQVTQKMQSVHSSTNAGTPRGRLPRLPLR